MKIFIASKLTCQKQQRLNEQIYNLCIKLGFKAYLPQKELPLDTKATPKQILEANEKAVDDFDFGIVVFDQAGAGTAMELEKAYMLNRTIIGYRSKKSQQNEDIGKMLQGAWDRLPKKFKVNSIHELENILKKLKSSCVIRRTTRDKKERYTSYNSVYLVPLLLLSSLYPYLTYFFFEV